MTREGRIDFFVLEIKLDIVIEKPHFGNQSVSGKIWVFLEIKTLFKLFVGKQERIMGTERKTPSLALGMYVNLTTVIFRPIKPLKFIES